MHKGFFWRIGGLVFLIVPAISFAAHTYFPDIQGHKHQAAIEFLQSRDLVNGYPDSTFRPEAYINRAELLTLIIGQKYKNLPSKDCFPDVKANMWFSKFVCKGKELGIVAGYPDGTFQPQKDVNFVEALIMLLRANVIPVDTIQGSVWYEDSVNQASKMNIIPLDFMTFHWNINRGYMAEMLTRLIKYKEKSLVSLNTYLGTQKAFEPNFPALQLFGDTGGPIYNGEEQWWHCVAGDVLYCLPPFPPIPLPPIKSNFFKIKNDDQLRYYDMMSAEDKAVYFMFNDDGFDAANEEIHFLGGKENDAAVRKKLLDGFHVLGYKDTSLTGSLISTFRQDNGFPRGTRITKEVIKKMDELLTAREKE